MAEAFDFSKPLDYPWQIPLAPLAPNAGKPEAERRREFARFVFECEREALAEGFGPRRGLHRDGRAGFFRFSDGGFALSREHADWKRLKEIGRFSEWGM